LPCVATLLVERRWKIENIVEIMLEIAQEFDHSGTFSKTKDLIDREIQSSHQQTCSDFKML
jgi:hypothetical protein